MQNLKKLKILKNDEICLKCLNIIQKVNLKASEEFKEKHPTHRGLPVGNQVDGLPTELRQQRNNESRKFWFPGGQRVLIFFAIGN